MAQSEPAERTESAEAAAAPEAWLDFFAGAAGSGASEPIEGPPAASAPPIPEPDAPGPRPQPQGQADADSHTPRTGSWSDARRRWNTETPDPAWTQDTRVYAEQTAQALGLAPEVVDDVDCRASVCSVRLAFADPEDAQEFKDASYQPGLAYRYQQHLTAGPSPSSEGEEEESAFVVEVLIEQTADEAGPGSEAGQGDGTLEGEGAEVQTPAGMPPAGADGAPPA